MQVEEINQLSGSPGSRSGDTSSVLDYCFELDQHIELDWNYRNDFFAHMIEMCTCLEVPDYINMSQCLVFFPNDNEHPAMVLLMLLEK